MALQNSVHGGDCTDLSSAFKGSIQWHFLCGNVMMPVCMVYDCSTNCNNLL